MRLGRDGNGHGHGKRILVVLNCDGNFHLPWTSVAETPNEGIAMSLKHLRLGMSIISEIRVLNKHRSQIIVL